MTDQQTERTWRETAESVAHLAEVAFLVGILYFIYLAPMAVIRGRASGLRQHLAAIPGLAFWGLSIYSLAVVL